MSAVDRLAKARARLESITKQRDAIQARYDNRHWTELDSATWSGIRRKPDRRADARRFDRYAREAEVFKAYDGAVRQVQELEARVAAEAAEAERVPFTAADLKDAKAVRDKYGWHPVVRVNGKTVTVGTGYSWTDRIDISKIREWR